MKYALINVTNCYATIMYTKILNTGFRRVVSNVPLSLALPGLVPRLSVSQWIQRTNVAFSFDEALAGYSAFSLESGDQLLPDPDSLSYVIEQPPNKVASEHYRKRKESGEILMNPYSRGKITVNRTAAYDYQSGTKYSVNGVTPTPRTYYVGDIFPSQVYKFADLGLPEPQYGIQAGERLAYVTITLRGDRFQQPAAQYILSPDPVFDFKDYGVDTELVTAAVADRNDGLYDLLTELGELPETLSFLTQETKKALFLAEEIDVDVKSARKYMNASKFAKYAAGRWLALRYALLPIFYSIKDISEVIKQQGREYAEFQKSKQILDEQQFGDTGGTLTFKVSGTCKHKCFIKSRYSPDTIMSEIRRFININLFTSVWEWTTLSFVADWVINFGDFLSALTGSDGAAESVCCYTIKDDRVVTIGFNGYDSRPKTTVIFNRYQRLVINPADHIGLSFRFDMGWKRYIDAAALSINPLIKIARSLK